MPLRRVRYDTIFGACNVELHVQTMLTSRPDCDWESDRLQTSSRGSPTLGPTSHASDCLENVTVWVRGRVKTLARTETPLTNLLSRLMSTAVMPEPYS